MQDFRMETFLAVCSCMNYTKAAQMLNLTQPAVSQHIHFLENYYGVKLFGQRGRRIYLTEAGALLRRTALTMKHDELHLRDQMSLAERQSRRYLFGATRTVAEYILPPDLARFAARVPGEVQMQVDNTRALLNRMDEGILDFAVVEGDFPKRDYDFIPYREERYVAAATPAVAVALAGHPVEDLLDRTLLLREEGSGTREILERYLAGRGLAPHDFARVMELGNIGAIKALVRAGVGVTFLYETALQENDGIARVELRDFDITHDIVFVFRKNSIFREEYRDIYRKFTEA